MGTGQQKIRQSLDDLQEATTDLAGRVQGLPLPEAVITGQHLWWVIKRATDLLDEIKVRLRNEAAAMPDRGMNTHRFDAPDGSHALVIPSSPTLEVKKDADMPGVKTALGTQFGDFFEEVIVYKPRKSFQTGVTKCAADQQAALLNVVTMQERAPRVVFKD
jgi:hypothetical protein